MKTHPLCTILLFFAGAAFSQSLPTVPGAQVTTLTPTPGYFSEPSVAVNPRNPQQIVAAYQVTATVAYSADAGRTWTNSANTAPKNFKVSGDVSIAYDSQGQAVLCYIAFDKLGTTNYWAHNATRNGIFVRRSVDGGKTWEPEDSSVIQHPTVPGIPFEDKPYIVADTTNGPFSGNLYVGWTEFSLIKTIILFSRSTDGGKTWSPPIEISTHEGLPRDDNGSVEGFTGAVAPDGSLYVVWADGNNIAFTESTDGGRTFSPSRSIISTAPPYFDVADTSRSNGFPQIALDSRNDKSGSVLYVTWSDYRNGDVDVFCATSSDHGHTWSSPVRVNTDPVHNGADQFFQWLAVDPETGAAYVNFYDRRDDPANRKTRVVLARSADGGKSFLNYLWPEPAFEAKEEFLGDYTGLAVQNGRVHAVWTEQRQAPPPRSSTKAKALPKHHTIVRVGTADFNSAKATP